MREITLTIDDKTLELAGSRATREGTSVDSVLREFLVGYAGADQQYARATGALLALSAAATSVSDETGWQRDDLHDRSLLR